LDILVRRMFDRLESLPYSIDRLESLPYSLLRVGESQGSVLFWQPSSLLLSIIRGCRRCCEGFSATNWHVTVCP
jgi:hypothetical protein